MPEEVFRQTSIHLHMLINDMKKSINSGVDMSQKREILFSTTKVTLIVFVIKLLGLVKQSVLAAVCGATSETDIFFIATGVLSSLSSVLFSAISISLLTMYTQRFTEKGKDSANRLINASLRVFIPISVGISAIFFIFSEEIGHFLAPSYIGTELQLLGKYIRLMSASFVFWCYYLVLNVVLESYKRFLPGRFQGFFQNVFLIIGAIFFYPTFGIDSLVYAFLLSSVAQCILISCCTRKKFIPLRGSINEGTAIKKLIRLAVPLIAGSAIYEINDIIDKQIATSLGPGNTSYLTYGSTINEIVTGVIVGAISTVLFAHFATWVAEGKYKEIETNLQSALGALTIIIFPIMVMCLVSGDQIIEILYGRGNFDQKQVMATYGVVFGYGLGFVFQAARANIVKVFYAFQDTRTPMVNGAISVMLNIALSLLLSKFIGIAGVALATSISMFVATVLLGVKLKSLLKTFHYRSLLIEATKGLVAATFSSALVYMTKKLLHANGVLVFLIEGIICIVSYMIVLLLFKSESVKSLLCLVTGMKNNRKID